MNIVDKEAFAKLCGMSTSKLAVYVSREKAIKLSDGKFDTHDPRNKLFIEKWGGRVVIEKSAHEKKSDTKKAAEKNASPIVLKSEEEEGIENIEQGSSQTYTESERLLKYYDVVKKKAEIEKLELQIQKSKGEIVPTSAIKPIFLEHNQSIITSVNDNIAEFVRLFSKKHSLSVEEIAALKGKVVGWVNDTMQKALDVSVKKIEAVIEDHRETKNVGEHG